ncbi:hypothetical protein B0H16DRAFT_1455486 [Mycena metata]|uniref:Uncharacterized protein n=1 Tax=Mycena metata TaxID=1033252 RepID=A0AAD7JI04_9AGAR|nr:hypothetical protein B0H16DRAFT_1455486 [Mycena metata]
MPGLGLGLGGLGLQILQARARALGAGPEALSPGLGPGFLPLSDFPPKRGIQIGDRWRSSWRLEVLTTVWAAAREAEGTARYKGKILLGSRSPEVWHLGAAKYSSFSRTTVDGGGGMCRAVAKGERDVEKKRNIEPGQYLR